MVTIDDVLSRLDLVRKASHGWMARCPCHDERTPSLSVRDLPGGISCHCFGCGAGTTQVLARLGLVNEAPPAPLTPREQALRQGRYQYAYRHRAESQRLDAARVLHQQVAMIRTEATRAGDSPETWDALAHAAELERHAWLLEVSAESSR